MYMYVYFAVFEFTLLWFSIQNQVCAVFSIALPERHRRTTCAALAQMTSVLCIFPQNRHPYMKGCVWMSVRVVLKLNIILHISQVLFLDEYWTLNAVGAGIIIIVFSFSFFFFLCVCVFLNTVRLRLLHCVELQCY
jgi:hypothetical protein